MNLRKKLIHVIIFFTTATEVRCKESAKGGLSFELRLADPVVMTPPKRPPSPPKAVSAADIEEKLKAAEDRRKVINHPGNGHGFSCPDLLVLKINL